MKYLETKHERNSAKITTLTVLIISLLLFVVGSAYKENPEEYGVAVNFGEPSPVINKATADNHSEPENSIENIQEEINNEELLEDDNYEEALEDVLAEEVKDNYETIEKLEAERLEQEKLEQDIAKQKVIEDVEKLEVAAKEEAEQKAKAEEKLLAQQQEEALRIKEVQEAKERLEHEVALKAAVKEKERKEAEAKAKAELRAREEADRLAKVEAERIAKARAEAEAKQKERERKEAEAKQIAEERAQAERIAKARATRLAKEKADREAASRTKAEADRKAAVSAAQKNKVGGSAVVGFALIEEAPIYPGCEGLNNIARKSCMSAKLKQFVVNNFDSELASSLGLSGNQKITIYFKISQTGQIIDIRAKAVDPKLAEEAKRVTNLLPKLKPGIQQGKAVTVPYALPIRFKTSN